MVRRENRPVEAGVQETDLELNTAWEEPNSREVGPWVWEPLLVKSLAERLVSCTNCNKGSGETCAC